MYENFFNENSLFTLDYNDYNLNQERQTESLTTLGNGYLGVRGSFESSISSKNHNPGTYIAGVYNRLISKVADREVDNEDLVCAPDWTFLTFKTPAGDWFNIDEGKILEYHKQLDLEHGLLLKKIRFKHPTGEISKIFIKRFVSMVEAHLVGIHYKIIPENYSGVIVFKSALKGDIINAGVERYSQLNQKHLQPVRETEYKNCILLETETVESHIHIFNLAQHRLIKNNGTLSTEAKVTTKSGYIDWTAECSVQKDEEVILEKEVAIFTSHDQEKIFLSIDAGCSLVNIPFEKNLNEHFKKWAEIWENIDIEIKGNKQLQKNLRIHLFHIMVTASHFNVNIDASVPARGLHGEAYRGHIFWDELFVFPFYNMHYPKIARALLMYRYNRLPKAREYAKKFGYKGAMFPWQSGSDGREETQTVHLNPISGEWGDDYSSLQRHISLAVAYNVWQYYYMTDDEEFLQKQGAEMLLDIAQFWVSKCQYNKETDRYEIHQVMGPNEFHEKMSHSSEKGLKDNAYTNILVVWLLQKCQIILKKMDRDEINTLKKKLDLNETDFEKWSHIIKRMNLDVENGIISQYDGFLKLKEIDWNAYKKKYKNIGRMDRILKAEGLSPDDFQVSKQADLLMLFFLLSPETIKDIVKNLGYDVTDQMLQENFDYYLQRTSHGSTLSLVVHSYVAAILGDSSTSWTWYEQALGADINDIQGGTTKEGIHLGLMAGTITNWLFAYVGLHFKKDTISFEPCLPDSVESVSFNFYFKKIHYKVVVEKKQLSITSSHDISTLVKNQNVNLQANKEKIINY